MHLICFMSIVFIKHMHPFVGWIDVLLVCVLVLNEDPDDKSSINQHGFHAGPGWFMLFGAGLTGRPVFISKMELAHQHGLAGLSESMPDVCVQVAFWGLAFFLLIFQ